MEFKLNTLESESSRYVYSGGAAHFIAGIAVVSIICLIVTGWLLRQPGTTKRTKVALLILWTLIPPIWFCLEFTFVYKPYGHSGTFESFKYGQELAAKVWLGVVTLLSVLVIKKDEPATGAE